MDKYIAPEMEVVEFETEDVITTSCDANIPFGCGGSDDPPDPDDSGTIWGD